jgi:hypothetical protein
MGLITILATDSIFFQNVCNILRIIILTEEFRTHDGERKRVSRKNR